MDQAEAISVAVHDILIYKTTSQIGCTKNQEVGLPSMRSKKMKQIRPRTDEARWLHSLSSVKGQDRLPSNQRGMCSPAVGEENREKGRPLEVADAAARRGHHGRRSRLGMGTTSS